VNRGTHFGYLDLFEWGGSYEAQWMWDLELREPQFSLSRGDTCNVYLQI
jgi:hypothetical protein